MARNRVEVDGLGEAPPEVARGDDERQEDEEKDREPNAYEPEHERQGERAGGKDHLKAWIQMLRDAKRKENDRDGAEKRVENRARKTDRLRLDLGETLRFAAIPGLE